MTQSDWTFDPKKYEGHTKGDWVLQKLGQPANPYIVAVTSPPGYSHPQYTVAVGKPTGGQGWPAVGKSGRDPKEMAANARLIADAPKLLAELVKARAEAERLRNAMGECLSVLTITGADEPEAQRELDKVTKHARCVLGEKEGEG